jgi:drug/metabolite transporter (DMT)-like permease
MDGKLMRPKFLGYLHAAVIFVNIVCLVAGVGRLFDWIAARKAIDLKYSMAFLAGSVVIFSLSSDRLMLLITTLLGTAFLGSVNSLLQWTPAALPVIVPCAVVGFLLLLRAAKRESRERQAGRP